MLTFVTAGMQPAIVFVRPARAIACNAGMSLCAK
jgi:hypothetical protein